MLMVLMKIKGTCKKRDFAQSVMTIILAQPLYVPNITEWKPLNNGMVIKWDDNAELSEASDERTLFLGYRIHIKTF